MNRNAQWQKLPLYLALCVAALAFGGLFTPGEWYESLNQAPWTPPNLVFPIVWTVLYVFIAIAGWQIAKTGNQTLLVLWYAQLILNALWSWIFFGQYWVTLALVDIVAISGLVLMLIIKSAQSKLTSVVFLLIPYLVWLCIATSLNAYVLLNN